MARANPNMEEGKKLLKQGHKLAKGGLFSKANPDEAEKAFEKARKKFRFMKPMTQQSVALYLESLEAIASVRDTMGLNNSAASAMEEASRACQNAADKKITNFVAKIPEYLQRGAYFYRLNNQYDLASRMIIKAATQQQDINTALTTLDLACDIQEEENRFKTCHEFYDASVKFCLENKRYKNALEFLDRQNKMYGKAPETYHKRIWRNILSKLIIQFHLKDVKMAQNMYYQGVEEYGAVSKNDEHELCEQFLTVFSAADSEALEHMQQNSQLGIFLINSVARIAAKLNMTDIRAMVVVEADDKKEDEMERKQDIEDAQKDVTEKQLQSETANVELDDDGAPNLIDM
eukprot:9512_1